MAVIGLGAMGLPISRRLAEQGGAVGAFDVDGERLRLAAGAGARACGRAAEAVDGAAVIVLAVRTAAQVDEALFGDGGGDRDGDGGAAGAIGPEAIVVLTSTVGVDAARLLAERLGEHGIALLDAPVSGGPVRAGNGDLVAFLGGSDDAVARARPVLDRLASTIVGVGPEPGDGQAMKTVNQLLCGVHIAAAAEALALADSLGLDLERTLAAMGAGAAGSFMLENRGPRIIEALRDGDPEVLSRIDIFVKDMGLVADAARAGGIPAPLAGAAEQLYRLAASAGLSAADDSNLARLYRGA